MSIPGDDSTLADPWPVTLCGVSSPLACLLKTDELSAHAARFPQRGHATCVAASWRLRCSCGAYAHGALKTKRSTE
jgi:hypothetical protein